jgi:hypothetical protein
MKQHRRPRAITHKIARLFTPLKYKYPHKIYPKEYYRAIWFNEKDFNGTEFVAKCEGFSKKMAVHKLIEIGFRYWMAAKFKEYQRLKAAHELQQNAMMLLFARELRKYAKSHQGIDIRKVI